MTISAILPKDNLFVFIKFYIIHIYQYDPCVFSCNVICNFATAYLTTEREGSETRRVKANTHITEAALKGQAANSETRDLLESHSHQGRRLLISRNLSLVERYNS